MKEDENPNMYRGAGRWLFRFARRMRHEPTEAEAVLWEALKGGKLGYNFRRQHPLGSFVLDFYCHAKKLAIELDGEYHQDEEQKRYDEYRSSRLAEAGINEIRFRNEEVLESLPMVLEKIKKELE